MTAKFQPGDRARTEEYVNLRLSAGYIDKSDRADLVAVLPPGAAVTIVGDSIIADSLTWWPVRTAGNLTGWMAESTNTGTVLLAPVLPAPNIDAIAEMYGLDAALARAVLKVESGGRAFADDGRMIIRFENHIFGGLFDRTTFDKHFRYNHASYKQHTEHQWRRDGGWMACHLTQAVEWDVFNLARSLDEEAAIQSTSMGAAQIMGFHYANLNYATPRAMFDAFSMSEDAQIKGFFEFLIISGALQKLQTRDLVGFARLFNGDGNQVAYANKIQQAMLKEKN